MTNETGELPSGGDEQLQAEAEAVRPKMSATFDELFGIGKDCFGSDAEFDEGMEIMRRSRHPICRSCQADLTIATEAPHMTAQDTLSQTHAERLQAMIERNNVPVITEELYEKVLGSGADCWTDEEFERFQEQLRRTRAEGRQP